MKEEIVVCPICHSHQISAGQKGFNDVAGAIGSVTKDSGLGFTLGSMGSGDTVITCLRCGEKFKPGEGALRVTDEGGKVTFVEHQDKNDTSFATLIFLMIVVIIVIVVIASHFSS